LLPPFGFVAGGSTTFVRISATDWIEGGWDIQQSVELARPTERTWSGPDRLLFWRQRAACKGSGRAGAIKRRLRSQIRREANILTVRWDDHITCSGRAHPCLLDRRTLSSSPANSCAIHIGHYGQRVNSGSQLRGLSNISELRRKAHKPAFQ